MGFLGLAACLTAVFSAAKPVRQETKAGQEKKTAETCGECHEEMLAGLSRQPHAAIGAASCTVCHSGAEKHVQEGGGVDNIFAFKSSDLPTQKAKVCLKCHADYGSRFMAGPHGKAPLDCMTCHSVHTIGTNPNLLKTSATQSCAPCHEDIFAKFALNERHRLPEGVLGCTTCHNPHEPAPRERLGGFKQEACLKCHTEKGGPFLYEHGASRVEGCTICHDPHGSPNRHMLAFQSVGDLCFGCHVFAPQFHRSFGLRTTDCVACHASIHGSNLSPIFLK
jgi:DmsE family decaheme c-type cytochrome